jgi:hypothetical protein
MLGSGRGGGEGEQLSPVKAFTGPRLCSGVNNVAFYLSFTFVRSVAGFIDLPGVANSLPKITHTF